MEDKKIVELFLKRDESSIVHSQHKYGAYSYTIAYSILGIKEDSDECVNDTWLRLWNSIPPQKPARLSVFIAKITRNLAYDKLKCFQAKKRGGGEIELIFDELAECIASSSDVEKIISDAELTDTLNKFLKVLPERERNIFISRYWFSNSIKDLSEQFSLSESNAKTILSRMRQKLKSHLESEDIRI